MKETPIQIGIVDDHNLFRKAVKDLLLTVDGLNVVFEAVNGNDLFDKLNINKNIDVLLLDLYMPSLSGQDALQILHAKYPEIRVIVLSMSTDLKMVSQVLDFGIYGFIPKEADISELLDAIRCAAKGKLYQNKLLIDALYWRSNHSMHASRDQQSFNEKQRMIFQLLWQEKTTQEIADEVFLSVSAVDKIKQQLKEKTGAKTTLGLIKYGIENRIISNIE